MATMRELLTRMMLQRGFAIGSLYLICGRVFLNVEDAIGVDGSWWLVDQLVHFGRHFAISFLDPGVVVVL